MTLVNCFLNLLIYSSTLETKYVEELVGESNNGGDN